MVWLFEPSLVDFQQFGIRRPEISDGLAGKPGIGKGAVFFSDKALDVAKCLQQANQFSATQAWCPNRL
ncbi:MAG TPA: hypothetical protein VJ984_11090 [Xanthomonadales bacterium]|nr:hypothetical protein [Xanthomonadales bacterium]